MLERGADVRDPLWDTAVARSRPLAERVRANHATLIHGDVWFGTRSGSADISRDRRWDGARIADPAHDVAIARNDWPYWRSART